MKAVKVEYQVQSEYVEQNKMNIRKVMDALQGKKCKSVLYSSYYLGDGRFMHVTVAPQDFSELTSLKEFKEFQEGLKSSQPIRKPEPSELDLVGVSMTLF